MDFLRGGPIFGKKREPEPGRTGTGPNRNWTEPEPTETEPNETETEQKRIKIDFKGPGGLPEVPRES